MLFIQNVYGLLDLNDLHSLKDENIIIYTENDFIIEYRDNLWLNITRNKTNKIVIEMNDRKFRPEINKIKAINSKFNYTLDLVLVFSTSLYEDYLSSKDDVIIDDDYKKNDIKKLLKKYKLKNDEKIVSDILDKKYSFFDLKFKSLKNKKRSIGFSL